MPTFHLSFDLNCPKDVDELCLKLRRLADSMKPEEKKEEMVEGLIFKQELMKRIGKSASTISHWRMEGMPYVVGKPCKYPWNETYEWIKKYKMLGKTSQ